MTVVGGLRARLIRDSIYHALYDAVDDLGWFDVGRRHKPIVFTGAAVANDEEIALNTVALSDEDLSELDLELGSTGVETRWTYYVDFYAEDDSIGKHFIHDIRDILGGRMSSIGRDHPNVVVYDYRMATPGSMFVVQLENIEVDRAHDFPKPWQKHWYACRFDVVDAYYDDGI
jgi:hypothetical protein